MPVKGPSRLAGGVLTLRAENTFQKTKRCRMAILGGLTGGPKTSFWLSVRVPTRLGDSCIKNPNFFIKTPNQFSGAKKVIHRQGAIQGF